MVQAVQGNRTRAYGGVYTPVIRMKIKNPIPIKDNYCVYYDLEESTTSGTHTKNRIQFLKLEELDSLHGWGIWIPRWWRNRECISSFLLCPLIKKLRRCFDSVGSSSFRAKLLSSLAMLMLVWSLALIAFRNIFCRVGTKKMHRLGS